jgi:hypothetical protein
LWPGRPKSGYPLFQNDAWNAPAIIGWAVSRLFSS